MTYQRYIDPVAISRMAEGNCPECGNSVDDHTGLGGPGCTLTDNGVAGRIAKYERDLELDILLDERRKVSMGSIDEDFVFCDVRWDGRGGVYDLGNTVIENHICAQRKSGHETHVCCCGAVKPEEIHEKGPGQVVVSP